MLNLVFSLQAQISNLCTYSQGKTARKEGAAST